MSTFINLNEKPKEKLKFTKAGKYVIFFHNYSGKVTVELAASDIEVDIFGLYIGKNQDAFKIETVQHHNAPRSWSNLLIKGVFDDESRLDYQGLIRIEKTGQQSHAYQKNQNIILSNKTYVESKPFLEILANDVFCTHGSTTGKLNAEQLFYVRSRGFNQKAAQALLVEGFVNEIFEQVQKKQPDLDIETLTTAVLNS